MKKRITLKVANEILEKNGAEIRFKEAGLPWKDAKFLLVEKDGSCRAIYTTPRECLKHILGFRHPVFRVNAGSDF